MTGQGSPTPDAFRGLGVVRAELAPGYFVAALPQPMAAALDQVDHLSALVGRFGDSAALIAFPPERPGPPRWIRARAVLTVDVVATEDPSA